MLWMCLHLPHLAVELRQPPDTVPTAITSPGPQRRVLAANRAARQAGISTGMDATLAQGRLPQLQLLARSPAQERRALMALGRWAYQWSGDICVDTERWLLTLEVGASLNCFGGLERLQSQLLAGSRALGYTLWPGIAPTPEGAALFARSGRPASALTLKDLRAEIARRPLADLPVANVVRQGLADSGLASIGEVLALPGAALARRFGPQLPDYLQRLMGQCPDPQRRLRMPERYRRVIECTYPVANAQALLFPLRRLLQELQGWLRGHDSAVDLLVVTLRHRDAPSTRLDIRLGAPQRDADVFTPLLREHLERTTLPEPVTHVALETGQPVAPVVAQQGLFETHATREAQWTRLLDRLRARLGDGAVRELALLDDHRPERAWMVRDCGQAPADTTRGESPTAALPARRGGRSAGDTARGAGRTGSPADGNDAQRDDPLPGRPLWIMEPRPLNAPPRLLGDPERIEAGWWDSADQRRDYYIARTDQGALWWVYRDLRSDTWFLHGIWA